LSHGQTQSHGSSNHAVERIFRQAHQHFSQRFDVSRQSRDDPWTIKSVVYKKGQFGHARERLRRVRNEQKFVTMEAKEWLWSSFKQIAGMLARRDRLNHQPGEMLDRGAAASRVDNLVPYRRDFSSKG